MTLPTEWRGPDHGGGALSDLRVLELATHVAGPFCGKLFADYGADVIKVESPAGGDETRRMGPFLPGLQSDETSGLFLYLNSGKRGLTLDFESAADRDFLSWLIKTSDVVIEGASTAKLDALGLAFPDLEGLRPGIILTSLSDFGRSGPWCDHQATGIIHYAASGLASVNGTSDREPLKHPGYQAYYQSGIAAFAATLSALHHRDLTGSGQRVELSALEVATSMVAPYLAAYAYTGDSPVRPPPRDSPRPPASTSLFPCMDGYVSFSPRGDPTWQAIWEFLGDLGPLDDPRFATMDGRRKNSAAMNEILTPYLAKYTMAELFHALGPLRVLVGMTLDVPGLLKDPHLADRGFFTTQHHPVAGDVVMPGPPFKMSATPASSRRSAPTLGQHNEELRTEAQISESRRMQVDPVPDPLPSNDRLPLEDVRAVVLTQAWSGAFATQLLADMGADVIQIEAPGRLDPWRGSLGGQEVRSDGETIHRPYNQRPSYNSVNRNKKAIALDLSDPEGRKIFFHLVKISDVVAENFASGVVGNLGIDYEDLRKVNPSIVMLRMPAFGCYGPYAGYSGNGGSTEPMTGMSHLLGYEGGPPMNSGVMYPDPIAGMMGFSGVLVALHHRARTGRGQLIDLSQQETLIACLGDQILEHTLSGKSPTRQGNRDAWMAPHGFYRCEDDEWVAIAVRSDDDWQSLGQAMELVEKASDPRFVKGGGILGHAVSLFYDYVSVSDQHKCHQLAP